MEGEKCGDRGSQTSNKHNQDCSVKSFACSIDDIAKVCTSSD